MEFLVELWLPIVASAAAVWVASAIIWMALPHHRKDWEPLPDEAAMCRNFEGLPAGNYTFPFAADCKSSRDPEFQNRWRKGPTGMLTIFGPMNMGRNMVLTLLTYLAVSVLIAYVAWQVRGSFPDKVTIFQVLGTVGVLSYCFAFIPNSVWFGASPRSIAMNFIDGVVYGLITGGVFALLWPASVVAVVPVAPA